MEYKETTPAILPRKNNIIVTSYTSPCGELTIGSFEEKLCICGWSNEKRLSSILPRLIRTLNGKIEYGLSDCNAMTIAELDEYFLGKRMDFDIPLLLAGTDFQKEVWQSLLSIPYGATESYSALASRICRPSAVRAVANANGANPITIFIPCHRIVDNNGSLTGYSGGLNAKRFLLDLERSGVSSKMLIEK